MILTAPYWAWGLLGLVIAQRLYELRVAKQNTEALIARGAVEHGAKHYPLFVILHASWLAALVIWTVMASPGVSLVWAAIYLLLQGLRAWVVGTLGPYWTTRIISVPDAPLITSGPFKYVRHPNYVVVVLEIFVLPMALGILELALVFSVLNAALLAHRIRIENQVLASRRGLAVDGTAAETEG